MEIRPGILARGPWRPEQVRCRWSDAAYEPQPPAVAAADAAIAALSDRGSPSHDGLAARLAGYRAGEDGLDLELEPMRWALRLTSEHAAGALTVLCAVRAHDGRWLAGRRAGWVATWAGRWTLGAGGSVEVGEDPVQTLTRELAEEWSVTPERLQIEALTRSPNGMAMLIGLAWLGEGAEVVRDPEHDEHAWWPADPRAWPEEADPILRRTALLLGAA